MATGMKVRKLEAKSHDQPDEVRTPNKTRVEVVRLDGFTLGRLIFSLAGDGPNASNRWSKLIAARSDTSVMPYPAALLSK